MNKIRNSVSVVFFISGLILLALLIRKIGFHDILDTLKKIGFFHLVLILTFPLTWTLLQTKAWHQVLQDNHGSTSLWQIFLAKITGEAVNTVTPLGIVGGDPYRIYMLQKTASATASAASVVIDRTLHTVAIFLLLTMTLMLAWIHLPLPPAWQLAMPISLVLFLFFLKILVGKQKKGIFTGISGQLKKIKFLNIRLQKWDVKLHEIDNQIGLFYQKSRIHFFNVLTLHFISRLLGAVEIWLIANFMGLPISLLHSLFLASLSILINLVFAFIPGGLGVMESGYGVLFYWLHLDPAYGIAIQLIRRLRTFFWIFLGLLVILLYNPSKNLPSKS